MAARSCPARSRASRSRCRMCSRRSASIRSARCRDEDLDELEQVACPSAGACGAQFTANTMATRVRGDRPRAAVFGRRAGALRDPRPVLHDGGREGDGTDRAQHPPARHRHPQGAGERRHRRRRLRRLDQCARCTCRRSRTNAASSSICSTSPKSSRRTPYIADLKPGGKYVAKDMFEAGGIPLLMKTSARSRLPARRLHDRHRPHHRRELEEREMESETRTWSVPPNKPLTTPAASSASRATSRRTARS